MIAAPRQRLKTGAKQRKEQQHQERAEFFALPLAVSTAPYRPFAVIAHLPIRRLAHSPPQPLTSTTRRIRSLVGFRGWRGDLPIG